MSIKTSGRTCWTNAASWRGLTPEARDDSMTNPVEWHEAFHISLGQHVPGETPEAYKDGAEPPYPANGSELDQLRWWAGFVEFHVPSVIYVIVEDGLFGFKFRRTGTTDANEVSGSDLRFTYGNARAYLVGLRDMAYMMNSGVFDQR
jgi:hypothetical protein